MRTRAEIEADVAFTAAGAGTFRTMSDEGCEEWLRAISRLADDVPVILAAFDEVSELLWRRN